MDALGRCVHRRNPCGGAFHMCVFHAFRLLPQPFKKPVRQTCKPITDVKTQCRYCFTTQRPDFFAPSRSTSPAFLSRLILCSTIRLVPPSMSATALIVIAGLSASRETIFSCNSFNPRFIPPFLMTFCQWMILFFVHRNEMISPPRI